MNLYTLHNKPESLHKHDVRNEEVPELAYNAVRYNYKKATPKQIAAIAKNAQYSYQFARLMGKPFKQGEKAIATDAGWSRAYVEDILNETRFPAGEKAIGSNPKSALDYAVYVINGEFPVGEKAIATNAKASYRYAQLIDKRFKMGEKVISKDKTHALDYANNFIGGMWPEGEAAIASSSLDAMEYISQFIKKRWPVAEPTIAKSSQVLAYIDKYIKGRWKDGEKYILKNRPSVIYRYWNLWVKDKWPEGEAFIKKSSMYTEKYNKILKRKGYSDDELI